MREVKPYRTLAGATRALDNGGRFYNVFAHADDRVVDVGELSKAAGASGARAFLFFEMALMDLPADERAQVVAQLSPALTSRLATHRPSKLAPSAVESEGRVGMPAIVAGYPFFVEDRTQFTGFIVMVTPVIMMIPIFDQFDVYEVFDTPNRGTPRSVIATTRGSKRLEEVYTRFGGLLRELQFEDKTGGDHGLFLETAYYTVPG